jgi:ABC-type transporter Mla maintaining outer membrane lipid asymmetry ATPase subunit MlaF
MGPKVAFSRASPGATITASTRGTWFSILGRTGDAEGTDGDRLALACTSHILLADEPTTALGVTIRDEILSLLLQLQRDFGMTVVLVSHDLGVIAQTCTRVAVMYAGQIVELADTDAADTAAPPYLAGWCAGLRSSETGRRD